MGLNGPELIANADAPMYLAKQLRSQYEFFDSSMAAGEVSALSPAPPFTRDIRR
jgi:hypothetical protein